MAAREAPVAPDPVTLLFRACERRRTTSGDPCHPPREPTAPAGRYGWHSTGLGSPVTEAEVCARLIWAHAGNQRRLWDAREVHPAALAAYRVRIRLPTALNRYRIAHPRGAMPGCFDRCPHDSSEGAAFEVGEPAYEVATIEGSLPLQSWPVWSNPGRHSSWPFGFSVSGTADRSAKSAVPPEHGGWGTRSGRKAHLCAGRRGD